MKVDAGPKISEVLPETVALTRDVFAWLAMAAGAIEGRDFFGKVVLELSYEAGQLTVARKHIEKVDR